MDGEATFLQRDNDREGYHIQWSGEQQVHEIRWLHDVFFKERIKADYELPDATQNALFVSDGASDMMHLTLNPARYVMSVQYIYDGDRIVGENQSDYFLIPNR